MDDDKTAWWMTEFVKDFINKEYSAILDNEYVSKYFGNCYSYYIDLIDHKAKLENDKFVSMYIKEGKEIHPFYNEDYLSYDINFIRSSILLTGLTRHFFAPLDLFKKEDLEWKEKIEHLYGMTAFFLKLHPDEKKSNVFGYHPWQIYDFFKKKTDFNFLKTLKEAASELEYGCDCDLKELDKMEDWQIFQLFMFRKELAKYRECLYLFDKKVEEILKNKNNNDINLS